MADHTPLPQCLVLIDERTALLRVTFETGFVSAQESKAAGFEGLLNVRRGPFDRDPFVHLVTVSAAHLALRHRMMMRQCECSANFQVALETCFRRLSWIDYRTGPASGFDVQTSGPVAGLATHIRSLFWSFAALGAGLTYDDLFRLQSRVSSGSEIAHNLFVAGRAFLRADELCAGDAGRSENCSGSGAARKQNDGKRDRSSRTP